MVRITLVVFMLAFAVGCGSEDESAAPAQGRFAQLVVTVDADGNGAKAGKQVELTCATPGENAACRAASRLKAADFEPVSPKRACTDIFGGPETATISGDLDGRTVKGTFRRANGCEVARWEKVSALLEQVE